MQNVWVYNLKLILKHIPRWAHVCTPSNQINPPKIHGQMKPLGFGCEWISLHGSYEGDVWPPIGSTTRKPTPQGTAPTAWILWVNSHTRIMATYNVETYPHFMGRRLWYNVYNMWRHGNVNSDIEKVVWNLGTLGRHNILWPHPYLELRKHQSHKMDRYDDVWPYPTMLAQVQA